MSKLQKYLAYDRKHPWRGSPFHRFCYAVSCYKELMSLWREELADLWVWLLSADVASPRACPEYQLWRDSRDWRLHRLRTCQLGGLPIFVIPFWPGSDIEARQGLRARAVTGRDFRLASLVVRRCTRKLGLLSAATTKTASAMNRMTKSLRERQVEAA